MGAGRSPNPLRGLPGHRFGLRECDDGSGESMCWLRVYSISTGGATDLSAQELGATPMLLQVEARPSRRLLDQPSNQTRLDDQDGELLRADYRDALILWKCRIAGVVDIEHAAIEVRSLTKLRNVVRQLGRAGPGLDLYESTLSGAREDKIQVQGVLALPYDTHPPPAACREH